MSSSQAGRLKELDELLNETSVDYWSDEGVTIAQGILAGLGGQEWDDLTRRVRAESPGWKEHLADALSHATNPQAKNVLVDLLFDPNLDVALTAAVSLRSQVPLSDADCGRVLARARHLLALSRPIYRRSLEALIGATAKPEFVS